MKVDPYKHKERWFKWKENNSEGILSLSKRNSSIIMQYLNDMESGLNISNTNKKGSRSYIRLNTLRIRISFLVNKFKEIYDLGDITKINEEQLVNFFADMRNGKIRKQNGEKYKSVRDYVKTFKAFWHWYQKVSRKESREIRDITIDLDVSREKPKWVYLTEEQVRRLCNKAKYEYKVLMMFLFDTGIRSPTELVNVRVSDLYNDFKELHIREETSKTFGRKIKLMLCSDLLKEYTKEKGLEGDNFLFSVNAVVVNRYLKRLAKRVIGSSESLGGENYSSLTLYDFRHSSACYWLPRYKSESALKYRFGWKKSDLIHYYTEFLGMKDTISEEDLLMDLTKTEIEKRLTKSENDNIILKDKLSIMEEQMRQIQELTNKLYERMS